MRLFFTVNAKDANGKVIAQLGMKKISVDFKAEETLPKKFSDINLYTFQAFISV